MSPSIGVNIRSGPGTGYGKVGAYPMGTVVDVLEERELPARPMQQLVLMEPAAVAEEVLERDGLSAPARISPAVMAVKVAMDMWRFTQEVFLDENSLFK